MSLYADDDLLPPDITSSGPSSLTTTAPLDPRTALAHAVQLPAESQAQYDALQIAGLRFEEYPDQLPELCGNLLPMVVDGGESMLRTWGLDMVALAVGRSALRGEIKADRESSLFMASHSQAVHLMRNYALSAGLSSSLHRSPRSGDFGGRCRDVVADSQLRSLLWTR